MSEEKVKPEPVKREVKPQNETAFHEHGTSQMQWDAIAAKGVVPDDLLERGYWAHVAAAKLRPFAKISVMAEDRSWYVELIVFANYHDGAAVAFVHPPVHARKAVMVAQDAEFETFDAGLQQKWSVRRLKDNKIFISGRDSKAEADLALADWLKSQGLGARRAA